MQLNKSHVIAANSSRQSSNCLVKCMWQSIICMACATSLKKKVSQEFWCYSIQHATRINIQIPSHLGCKLTFPFKLVHGTKPDTSTWFKLFSISFFHHTATSQMGVKTKMQDMLLDGIAVGCHDKTNIVLFCNPIAK